MHDLVLSQPRAAKAAFDHTELPARITSRNFPRENFHVSSDIGTRGLVTLPHFLHLLHMKMLLSATPPPGAAGSAAPDVASATEQQVKARAGLHGLVSNITSAHMGAAERTTRPQAI